MNLRRLYDKYILAGATPPFLFYLRGILWRLVPRPILIRRRKRLLRSVAARSDARELYRLRDTLCIPDSPFIIPEKERIRIADITFRNFHSRYAFDAERILRHFPADAQVAFFAGDNYVNPPFPTLVKGRRLDSGMENGVILKLDSIRHYLDPHDPIPFAEKIPKLFFRGDIAGKPHRIRFMEQWHDNPLFDIGDTSRRTEERWQKPFAGIGYQMKYRFILALEGNDVASALQWIMASNCVPVMTRPTVETWLLHSEMKPGVHYIEIADDYSDVADKLEYYISHPEEAEAISRASRQYVRRFRDRHRELLISLMVVEKYLALASQPTD